MTLETIELPAWSFEVKEISVGVWRACGSDRAGRKVEATGTDPDALLHRCTRDAAELVRAEARAREGGTG
jgi:hypothetical protein